MEVANAQERKNSFTLVEFLIVIVIIGILATMAVPQYQKMVEKARWVEAKNMLGAIRQACILYYQEKGLYPFDNNTYWFNAEDQGLLKQKNLDIDIPPAKKDGRYYYLQPPLVMFNTYGVVAYAVYDKNRNGIIFDVNDPDIYIKLDGTFGGE